MVSDSTLQYNFSGKKVSCFFDVDFELIDTVVKKDNTIFITDENVYALHREKFSERSTIVIQSGEEHKNQQAANEIIDQLINLHADRKTFIVGVGGGVVTDISGYVASVYMRGLRFGFVPTTILAMVDAAVGGKNGIDVGVYKNLVGVIRQPEFLLYDYTFLDTLPDEGWVNGFAEIIKHACIKDKSMFAFLEQNSLMKFQSSAELTGLLIKQNVDLKFTVVLKDEHETGDRKLLNFGHTIGHAIENASRISHGSAISIGMAAACKISGILNGFKSGQSEKVIHLLKQYQLPVEFNADPGKTWEILQHDKKKAGNKMDFVLLNQIGDASVHSIEMEQLHEIFKEIAS
ncbi:MAG: 3-dehydroquinate synthase [Ginsengibacter sp.]